MPIVNSKDKRKLSPLEEETQVCELMERNCKPIESGGGVSAFTTLGTLILTARPYESTTRSCHSYTTTVTDVHGATLQGEIFQTVTKESLLTMQEQMEKLWYDRIPMCIEVKGQDTSSSYDSSVLFEQWLIQALPRRSHTAPIPSSFLTHAVQSFLHFSQIRSWIVSYCGSLPFNLTYRVCAPGEDTSDQFYPHTPKHHTFPPSPLSPLTSLQVSVHHLPRLKAIPPQLTNSPCGDVITKFRDLSLSKSAERLKDLTILKSTEYLQNPSLFSKSAECIKDVVVSNSVEQLRPYTLSKSAERFRDLSTMCPSSRLVTPPHLIRNPPPHTHTSHLPHPAHPHSSSPHSLSPHHKYHHSTYHHTTPPQQETFPFSPPQPSPMSPKLLAGLGEPLQYHSLLNHDESRHGVMLDNVESSLETSNCSNNECSCQAFEDVGNGHSCTGSFCFENGCVREGKSGGDRGALRDGEKRKNKMKSETRMKQGTVRSPAASSPVPFMRRCMSENKHKHKRSSAINIRAMRPSRPLRSNSAPATMHSLSLLGTFEESVLNGRLEPCGFVEGFTAELGASGSFCPRHITYPVTAAFFNLSDSGTSPYLGVIDLSTTGKRGYHVAKKGTVQVTLFNPNGTVIKMFVVTYNFSDMPPNSQTFLRQKIISHSPSPASSRPHIITSRTLSLHSPPLLHYLIHLRFLCSRSGRVYLHKDIRLIFARRAPDTEPDFSRVILTTITEAPPSPKYGPLDGQVDKAAKLVGAS